MGTNVRQMLNRILPILGETKIDSSVGTITESYHQLLLTFLNEIKEEVEAAHTWRALRHTVSVTVTAGSNVAVVTGATERSHLVRSRMTDYGRETPLCFDVTDANNPIPLNETELAHLLYLRTMDTDTTTVEPVYFALDNTTSGELKLQVYPTPSTTRTIEVTLVTPQAEFADSDMDTEIKVPARPIIVGTLWYAQLERGEELGAGGLFTEERYRTALDDAVALDMAEQGDLTLVVV